MSNVQSASDVIKGEKVEFDKRDAEDAIELKAPPAASSIFAAGVMTVIALCLQRF